MPYFSISSLIALTLLLAGCSMTDKYFPDEKVQYKTSKVEKDLEIPPDLTGVATDTNMSVPGESGASSSASKSDTVQAGQSRVMPTADKVQVKKDGARRWLVVKGEPDSVWPWARNFWTENGFNLEKEDPIIGVMETVWMENRADIPDDPIRNVLKKGLDMLYSSPTRDKYRVRLERSEQPGFTEVYLTHRGMKSVVTNKTTGTTAWEDRPSDPELEAEMLTRLMVSLGVEQGTAAKMLTRGESGQPTAKIFKSDTEVVLMLEDDFARAWSRTGSALDRLGFSVVDKDRSKGTYLVRYHDAFMKDKEKGIFSSLAFWKKDEESTDEYQISLNAQGGFTTRVIVLDKEGKVAKREVAEKVLTILYEELK